MKLFGFSRLPYIVLFSLLLSLDPAMQAGNYSVSFSQAQAQSKLRSLIDRLRGQELPKTIAKSNGRIEATQIDIAAKYAGRLKSVLVEEGDDVEAGQVITVIESPETEAQLNGARANVLQARQQLLAAEALIAQRKSDLSVARSDLERGEDLVAKGYLSKQAYDVRKGNADAAEAALKAAEAQMEQAQFAIATAQSEVQRLEAMLVDLTLVAPKSGRVQYKLANTGEVIAAGGRVLTLLDLQDVYMTIYLPAAQAGLLAIGDEARIIMDPVPHYVIPATISFVASEAQFTPKSVETAEEREKLVFRIKLQVDKKLLTEYHRYVKTGIRGMGFVRLDASAQWPDELKAGLSQK
jgi:Multidrug resistance efflux pump